jgi:hypothetical protein
MHMHKHACIMLCVADKSGLWDFWKHVVVIQKLYLSSVMLGGGLQ